MRARHSDMAMTMRRSKIAGMNLIELMIVIAIIALLATIAYPTYMNSIRKGRRAEGMAAITTVTLAQEKLRASCPFYGQTLGGAANVCGADAASSVVRAPDVSENGRYNLALSAASGTDYTVTATAVGDQAKDNAAGVTCTLVITVDAMNPDGVRTPAGCWN